MSDKFSPYIYVEFCEESCKSRAVMSHVNIVRNPPSLPWDEILIEKNEIMVKWQSSIRSKKKSAGEPAKAEFLAKILLVGDSQPDLICQMSTDLKHCDLKSGQVMNRDVTKRVRVPSQKVRQDMDDYSMNNGEDNDGRSQQLKKNKNELNAKALNVRKRKADVLREESLENLKKAVNMKEVLSEISSDEEGDDFLGDLISSHTNVKEMEDKAGHQKEAEHRLLVENTRLKREIDEVAQKLESLKLLKAETSDINLRLTAQVKLLQEQVDNLIKEVDSKDCDIRMLESDLNCLQTHVDTLQQDEELSSENPGTIIHETTIIEAQCKRCTDNTSKVQDLQRLLLAAKEVLNTFRCGNNGEPDVSSDSSIFSSISPVQRLDGLDVGSGAKDGKKKKCREVLAFQAKIPLDKGLLRAKFEATSLDLTLNPNNQLRFRPFCNDNPEITIFNDSEFGFMWSKEVCRRQSNPRLTGPKYSIGMKFRDIILSMLDPLMVQHISFGSTESSVKNVLLAPLHLELKQAVADFMKVDATDSKVNSLFVKHLVYQRTLVLITDLMENSEKEK